MNATEAITPNTATLPFLASDADRERTAAILRDQWVAGRLTLAELEERSQEAWAARYMPDLWCAVRELPVPAPPAPAPARAGRPAEAVGSIVLSSIGACVFLLSFGLLAIVTLPVSTAGWALGRRVRRDAEMKSGRTMALAGEVLGASGTVFSCLALTACAVVVTAGSIS